VAVQASDVKKLRERTGAGMLDCKNALSEADGDFKKAEKILKERGIAAASKRSGRATNEGRIFSSVETKKGGLVELACETDFVARNEDFITFGNKIVNDAVKSGSEEITPTIEEEVKELVSTMKENIKVRRIRILEAADNELIVDYIHGEGRIGVLIKIKAEDSAALEKEEVKTFAFDCALHVAAFNPTYLSKEVVDKEYLTEQEQIFTKQAEQLGKPENVMQGIVKGKLNKHLSEICFLNQGFVKEEKKSVEKIMNELSKSIGSKLSITDYAYFSVGEELSS
jgi:elongation factor Ts